MALTFEPFAECAEYQTVNRQIVEQWVGAMMARGQREVKRLVDVATGVGTMVQLFLDTLPGHWRQPLVVCVDKSEEVLRLVRDRLGSRLDHGLQCLNQAAERMRLPRGDTDVVVCGNGIHYLTPTEQATALQRIREALRPDGWFFANTAFYAESRPAWTLPFYRKQVKLAVQGLRDLGITRAKSGGRPPAGDFLSRKHYENLLLNNGFRLERVDEVEARLRQRAWELISGYQQYAEGALHGYPLDAAATALQEAVAPALQEHGLRDTDGSLYIPRNWLALAARPA